MPSAHGVLDGARLLENLLEHVMRECAPLGIASALILELG